MGSILCINTCHTRLCRNSGTGANIINSGKRWRSEYDAGSMRCRITVCIAKEHLSYASGTCTKLLSVGNISGV